MAGAVITLVFAELSLTCKYITETRVAVGIWLVREERGRIVQVQFTGRVVGEVGNLPICPPFVIIEGRGSETVAGAETAVTIKLI